MKKKIKPSDILKTKKKWCQNAPFAVGINGSKVQWRLWGAFREVYGDGFQSPYLKFCKTARKHGIRRPIAWQDHPDRKFSEVRKLLLEAGE